MATPSWSPLSEADILAAASSGTLSESHYLEVKRELTLGTGGNNELARDLAQFAIDGGAMLIGIEEDKRNRTWTLRPTQLQDLAERVDLVARSTIDPPLTVRTRSIPARQRSGLGYLLIEVDPSPLAPHMVGGIYFARGGATRVRLSDSEVLRFHGARLSRANLADELLDAEIGRDPIEPAEAEHGHLYLIAEPEINHPDMAIELVRGDPGSLHRIITTSAEQRVAPELRSWAPTPRECTCSRRADGVGFSSFSLREGRQFDRKSGSEKSAIDIEVLETGGIRVFVGRLTDSRDCVLDGLAVAFTVRLIQWAVMLSEVTDYRGGWTFGIAGNRLRGLCSSAVSEGEASPYNRDSYRATTSATKIEMTQQPARVAGRLMGLLLRGLGTSNRYQAALEPVQLPGEPAEPAVEP